MSRTMLLVSTATLSLGIMGVSSSRADNCTGYDALVSQSAETIDLGHGLKQTSSRSQSILFSNDSIYNLVAGECASTMLHKPKTAKLNRWATAPAAIRMAIPKASLFTLLLVSIRESGSRLEERASLQGSRARVGPKLC
jgi:hypothetical protein